MAVLNDIIGAYFRGQPVGIHHQGVDIWLPDGSAPTPVPPAEPSTLAVDRSMYPDGGGRWSHLGDWTSWPTVYWVPPGSTFAAPNGEQVIRSRQFNGDSVGGDRVAIIKCPEVFEDIETGTNLINMRGAVVQGHHIRNTGWLGRAGVTVYRTKADADAATNGLSMRPGKWYYPSTDERADSGLEHRQAIYAQGWYPTNPAPEELHFQAWEGTYLEGDWIPEGMNWNQAQPTNMVLVLNGFRQDRVWVLFKGASSKEPGGDAFQCFNGPPEMHIINATVAATSLQGMFFQNAQNGTPRVIDLRNINIRWEDDLATYGGDPNAASPGFQIGPAWTRGSYGETWRVEDVNVFAGTYPKHQLVWDVNNMPEVNVVDVADFVTPAMVGVNYMAPEDAPQAPAEVSRVQHVTRGVTAGPAFTSLTTAALPTPATAGNVLVAGWQVDKNAGTFTPPPGWTTIATQSGASVSIHLAYKVATGGETTATASWATAQVGANSIIAEYAGVSTSDPIGPVHTPSYSDTPHTGMTLDPTPAEANGAALAFFGVDSLLAQDSTTEFRPSGAGFTWVATSIDEDPQSAGAGAAALCERMGVVAGEDLSTAFTWTRNDQTAGVMVLLNGVI